MLIGITVDKFRGIDPSIIIRIARHLGLNFVELTRSVFDDLPNVLAEIGNMKTGIHLPNFADQGFDFSYNDRKLEIYRLIDLINANHHKLNIQYCLSHPPENSSALGENLIPILFDNLKKLNPPIIIENIESLNQHQFDTFYAKAQLALGDQLLGQCFDAPHYYVRGDNPIILLQKNFNEIRCIHLSDCKNNKDAHLPFNSGGELPVEDILLNLKNLKYDGIINLELLPRTLNDIKKVIQSYLLILKSLDKARYFLTKLRLIFFAKIIRKTVIHVFQKK